MARVLKWLFPPARRHEPSPEEERRAQQQRLEELERLAYLAAVRDVQRRRGWQPPRRGER